VILEQDFFNQLPRNTDVPQRILWEVRRKNFKKEKRRRKDLEIKTRSEVKNIF